MIEEINDKIALKLKTIKEKQFEKDINHLKELRKNKGKAAATFHLKDKILGNKKTQQEPVVVIDPETGSEVTKPTDIKKASLKYCVDLLKDREPKEEFREIVQNKDVLHQERMREDVIDDIEELPFEVFTKTLSILKVNKARNMSS